MHGTEFACAPTSEIRNAGHSLDFPGHKTTAEQAIANTRQSRREPCVHDLENLARAYSLIAFGLAGTRWTSVTGRMPSSPTPASQLPLFHVIGFSGHRQLADSAAAANALRAALLELTHELKGNWVALSSVAAGSDQLFVQAARSLGLSWHAILPLPRAEFAQDFSPTEWQAVEAMIAEAEHTRVITENGTREDAYLDCGIETVNSSDVLLAIWDGQPARGKGGTADVIAYARELGRPVVVIDAQTFEVRRENFERIKRDDSHFEALNRLPAVESGWATNPFGAPDSVLAFQYKCDHAATQGSPQFRLLIVGTVLLHVVATVVAAGALAFGLHWVLLPWLKLSCLVGALIVAAVLRHHHLHHNWVRCRLAAEFCRSALSTWGLPRATPLFHEIDLTGMRELTRTLHILHSRSATSRQVTLEEFRATYLRSRIDDQLAYYRKQERRALPLLRRLRFGFAATTILAIVCTAAYALSHTFHLHWLGERGEQLIFAFLPITLPVIAAAMISFVSINDLQRRVARYREMCAILEDGRTQLSHSPTWNTMERVVFRIERALLQEVLEWHSITSFSESH